MPMNPEFVMAVATDIVVVCDHRPISRAVFKHRFGFTVYILAFSIWKRY
jgi:hypothetical protein